jgi:cytochrome c556
MAQMSHPDDRRKKITERQKALNLIVELKKREKGYHMEKVKDGIQNLHKLVKDGTSRK